MSEMSHEHPTGQFPASNIFAFGMRALHRAQAGQNVLLQDIKGASVTSELSVFHIPV